MTLSEMRRLLADRGIRLTKALGQNFLHDGNQLRRIVGAGEVCKADRVLEVGPGLGPLTELLLVEAGEVLAIEKDRRLIELLQQRFDHANNLTLLHDDALKFLQREPRDWQDWKLVANLPYSVASPILVELAQAAEPPRVMVATLQLEVARRLVAEPDSESYGLLTLLVQLSFEFRELFKIPASCFFPAPEVDSACLKLVRRAELLLPKELNHTFCRLVKQSFSQRRKMMFKLLKEHWPVEAVSAAFEQAGLTARVRAEAVSLEQFVRLTRMLAATSKP